MNLTVRDQASYAERKKKLKTCFITDDKMIKNC